MAGVLSLALLGFWLGLVVADCWWKRRAGKDLRWLKHRLGVLEYRIGQLLR